MDDNMAELRDRLRELVRAYVIRAYLEEDPILREYERAKAEHAAACLIMLDPSEARRAFTL